MKKEFIVWQKKWETGIKTIDDQHKHFVGIVNKTFLLNDDGKDKKILWELLTDLMQYARIHFSTEESYFEDTEYPDADTHKEKHLELLGKVLKFSKKFESQDDVSQIVEELLVFLRGWLDDHLIKVDSKYVPWLTEHGIK